MLRLNKSTTKWKQSKKVLLDFLEHSPELLLHLIESDQLETSILTFAAEYAGRIEDKKSVRKVLIPLLEHKSDIVREGAVYGLAPQVDVSEVEVALVRCLASTKSHTLQQTINDILNK